jgi:hypothetical protein
LIVLVPLPICREQSFYCQLLSIAVSHCTKIAAKLLQEKGTCYRVKIFEQPCTTRLAVCLSLSNRLEEWLADAVHEEFPEKLKRISLLGVNIVQITYKISGSLFSQYN